MHSSVLTAAPETGIALYTVPVLGVELGQTALTGIGILVMLLLLMGSGFFSSSVHTRGGRSGAFRRHR